jgi:hypothetical protein
MVGNRIPFNDVLNLQDDTLVYLLGDTSPLRYIEHVEGKITLHRLCSDDRIFFNKTTEKLLNLKIYEWKVEGLN